MWICAFEFSNLITDIIGHVFGVWEFDYASCSAYLLFIFDRSIQILGAFALQKNDVLALKWPENI
jgi:hypothetical protein